MGYLHQFRNYFLILILCIFSCQMNAQNPNIVTLSEADLANMPLLSLLLKTDYAFVHDPQLTYAILEAVIQRATKTGDFKNLYEALRSKGLYLERQLRFQEALNNYKLAEKAIKGKDNLRFRNIQTDIGISHRKLFQYTQARMSYASLIDSSLYYKDFDNLQRGYCGMGTLYYTVEDFENAIRYYQKALQVVESIKDTTNIYVFLDNLADAYSSAKQYPKALESIEKAVLMATRTHDNESNIFLLERHGRVYADMGQFDDAFAKINQALSLCQDAEHNRDRNNLTIAKAEFYLKQQNTTAAELSFKETLKDLTAVNVDNLTKIYYELGKIYQKKNDISQAERYFTLSKDLAEKNQFLRYEEWNHRALYTISRLKKQDSQALFHFERANILRDSLFNYEKSGSVTELQFRYDLAQRTQELKESELHLNRILMWSGSFAALLTVLALMFIIYMRGQTNRALVDKNTQIERQKAQLEAYNKEILTKNQEIEEQKRLLEESNGMLKQFSYAVAHDLKEPLRNIGNFVAVIKRRYIHTLPSEATEYFNFVTTGVSRMGKMLDGLLKYSMMSMAQIEDIENIHLKQIVDDVTDSLRLVIEDKHAQIITPDTMPDLQMNRIHTTQLLQNLVSNALKFADKTPIVEIRSQETKDNVTFSVKDNGIGIEKQSGTKLFNLFHRLHRNTDKFEGTGVGLALCKTIVEKYGGKIWFESEENMGTEFFVMFPKAA